MPADDPRGLRDVRPGRAHDLRAVRGEVMSGMEMVDRYAGVNLQERARRCAAAPGCTVEWVERTREITVAHPDWHRRVRLNSRKKSAPRIHGHDAARADTPRAAGPGPPPVPIRVQRFGEFAWAVVRGGDCWTGTAWIRTRGTPLVSWARQDARAIARRLRGARRWP